jgi:hypothetical protein
VARSGEGFTAVGPGSQHDMAVGAFFILIIVVVVLLIIGGVLWAVRAGLWVRETSPRGEGAEGAPRAVDERQPDSPQERARRSHEGRPDHTTVDDPGHQTYVGTGDDA